MIDQNQDELEKTTDNSSNEVTDENDSQLDDNTPDRDNFDLLGSIVTGSKEGILVKDFKMKLLLAGILKENDVMTIGKLSRINQFHFSIENDKEAKSTVALLLCGELKRVTKDAFSQIYLEGVYAGSDLYTLSDNDDLLLLRGSYLWKTDGELIII